MAKYDALGKALDNFVTQMGNDRLNDLNNELISAKIGLELTRDDYLEAKKSSNEWENALNVIVDNFSQTNVSLETLNQQLGTPGGYNVVNNIKKPTELNYASKAKYYDNVANEYRDRYNKVNSILRNQIEYAKQIQQGGIAAPILGSSEEDWNLEDVNIEAYRFMKGLDEETPSPL
jgi:Zn-dependent metalloprotease